MASGEMHSYAKPPDRPLQQPNGNDRVPSFLLSHTYSKKRPRGPPSGLTPHRLSKKSTADSDIVTPQASEGKENRDPISIPRKQRWTEEETEMILHEAEGTTIHSTSFWRECARKINLKFGTARTEYSCRLQYKRNHKEHTAIQNIQQDLDFDDVAPLAKTVETACQTDISVPIIRSAKLKPRQHMRNKDNDDTAETTEKRLLRELKTIYSSENSGEDDRTLVQIMSKLLMTNSVEDLSFEVFSNRCLRESVWRRFLIDISESANHMCQRRKSVLYNKDYHALESFNWSCIIDEMLHENRRLTQVLLTTSISNRKSKDETRVKSIVKSLGLTYGVLMKNRWKELSLIQRLVSVVMFDEKVHQKVIVKNYID